VLGLPAASVARNLKTSPKLTAVSAFASSPLASSTDDPIVTASGSDFYNQLFASDGGERPIDLFASSQADVT
jgi:hypothetical protein